MDDAKPGEPSEIHRSRPFPFPDGRFPDDLGAVIQKTVLTGEMPALEVVHAPDGSWAVSDGVNDPNLPGVCEVGHIDHVVSWNSSVAGLATMPPGHIAQRTGPGEPWRIKILEGWDDEE